MNNRIFGNEVKYLKEVLNTEFRSSMGGIFTKRLEKMFCDKFGVNYAISHTNGTATMHSILEAWGIGVGDEVIVPPLTMSATAFAVLQSNATPIFADVCSETFVIDPISISERITSKTKAIITVSLFGLSPEMDNIKTIAKAHNLKVLEDNAECFLGEYKNQIVGSIGDAASFSFQSSKHMTSGEGGMVTTNCLETANKIRRIQSLGYAGVSASKSKITKEDIQDPNYERHLTMGWNYRMSELCSAVALAQLENLNKLVEKRIIAGKTFNEIAQNYKFLKVQKIPKHCKHTYWTFAAKLDTPKINFYTFRKLFRKNGGDGIYSSWQLTYLEPMFKNLNLLNRERFIDSNIVKKNYSVGSCPIAEDLQPRLLQFKTNYWSSDKLEAQAEALQKTCKEINGA